MSISNPLLKINGNSVTPWFIRFFCIIIILIGIYNYNENPTAAIIIGSMFFLFFVLIKNTSLSVYHDKLVLNQLSVFPFLSNKKTFNYNDIEKIEHLQKKEQSFLVKVLFTGSWINKDERIAIYKSQYNFKILKLHFRKKHVNEIVKTVEKYLVKSNA